LKETVLRTWKKSDRSGGAKNQSRRITTTGEESLKLHQRAKWERRSEGEGSWYGESLEGGPLSK